jgi:hypothetical protein
VYVFTPIQEQCLGRLSQFLPAIGIDSGFIAAEIIIIAVASATLAAALFVLIWSQSDMLFKQIIS